ncbi:MAG: hypothetical protein ACI8ZB_001172 [Desulforhopalus sp.]|jgi:hypothetical protein
MKGWIKNWWSWSWLITLPVTVVFIYWSWSTIDRYSTFGVRFDAKPAKMTLLKAGKLEAYHLKQKMRLALSFTQDKEKVGSKLRAINLFVPESNLAQLNANLPHSGFEYVKGGLWNGEKLQKVKVKYRGDFLPHWGFFKKSLRIKTKKSRLFEGMRAFNLTAPKGIFQLHNYLGYRLADSLGLMTPRSEMVTLNLNGKRQGLHLMVEQLEELTLRYHARMPGDLYVGELAGKDAYAGVGSNVFDHSGLWKKIAINNHFPDDSRKPLERLLFLINSPSSEEIQQELNDLLDMEAWAKFSAFETLTQTFHFDKSHNWRLYFDPMRSKFEPIIWDPLAWTTGAWQKNINQEAIRTRLHKALFKNAHFIRLRHNVLKNFFQSDLSEQFLRETDQIISDIIPVIASDPNLQYPEKKILKKIRSVRVNIDNVFADVKENILSSDGEILYTATPEGFNFLVTGSSIINQTTFIYEKALVGDIGVTITYWLGDKKNEIDVSGGVNIRGRQLDLRVPLLRGMSIQEGDTDVKNSLKFTPGYYELKISGISSSNKPYEISVDRGLGTIEYARHASEIQKHAFKELYGLIPYLPLDRATRWRGEIEVVGKQEIFGELIIDPGTIVRLQPGATLIVHGRLLAVGTADKPIHFIPAADNQSPWGALVLKGDGANNSRLSHCEFSGGSGLKSDLFEYTAMFSVHEVNGVEVSNCLFRDSQVTDDMVHVVYSKIRFYKSRFERSLMDALDIDISDAVIEECKFSDSGNDSIDLMTSNAIVKDTLIENGKDKAASVGEGSHLLAINNIFRNNVIGVQVKDGSVASLYNIDFIDNDLALDAYKKNWRYMKGGSVYMDKSRMIGNEKVMTVDKKSNMWVNDSYIDKPVEINRKRIKLSKTVDSVGEVKSRTKRLEWKEKELELMYNFDTNWLNQIDAERRGALNVATH